MPTVRYFAAARAASGVESDLVEAATSLREVLAAVVLRHPDRLGEVLARCSFVVDGAPVGRRAHETVALGADSVVEVLPPFAGG